MSDRTLASPASSAPSEAPARMITAPFLIVTAATGLFFIYVGIQIPLLPRLIEERLGGSEIDIGLNLAAFSASAILVRPVLGPWGDRYGRRMLMIGGSLLAAVAVFVAAFVDSRWTLLPLRALCGMGEGAMFVGAATLISDLAPPSRRAEAASYFSVAVFCGIGVGPILGEAIATDDRFGRGLVLAAGCALAAAVCSAFVPRSTGVEAAAAASAASDPDADVDRASLASDGIEAAEPSDHRFHRAALRPGLVLALGIGGFVTFSAYVPEHARDVGLSGSKWVFATYSIVCGIVRLVGAKVPERIGLDRAVEIALGFLSLALFVLFAWNAPAGLFVGAVFVGVGMSFQYPALMALTVNRVPERERARAISTFTMFFEIGSAVGAIVFGFLAELTGKRGGFLGGAVSALVGLWYFTRVLWPSLQSRPISASGDAADATH